jgi:hypothetical protein
MKTDFTPYLVRLVIVFVVAALVAIAINEGAYLFQKDRNDRQAGVIQLVIPAGTAMRIAQGEPAPGIPEKMSFVVGDVLEVKNEDSVDHQLGPVWVPPGTTGRLVLQEANRFSYSCSFSPDNYLGLDVMQRTSFTTRLTGLMISAPTLAAFLFIYSLAVYPVKPRQQPVEVKA